MKILLLLLFFSFVFTGCQSEADKLVKEALEKAETCSPKLRKSYEKTIKKLKKDSKSSAQLEASLKAIKENIQCEEKQSTNK